jgi:hypothetical protein
MKTQTEHTPGPWSIEAVKDYLRTHDTGIDSGISESIANAHIIASAPDLLSALEKLLSRSSTLDQSATHEGLQNCEAIAQAREAIRKARGEA